VFNWMIGFAAADSADEPSKFATTTITLLGSAVGLRAPIGFVYGCCERTRRRFAKRPHCNI
jgi:hypothetical protein